MKIFSILLFLVSFSVSAKIINCDSNGERMTINAQGTDIQVIYKGEIAPADGLVSTEEVDLVAKFRTYGEIVIFAKIGKNVPENYLFFKGQKNPVQCR
ncbi:MAG: hypothetical protein AB7I27_03605 [Bacteriovoracaceae bacterium]